MITNSDEADLTIEAHGGDPREAVRALPERLAACRDALDKAEALLSCRTDLNRGIRTGPDAAARDDHDRRARVAG